MYNRDWWLPNLQHFLKFFDDSCKNLMKNPERTINHLNIWWFWAKNWSKMANFWSKWPIFSPNWFILGPKNEAPLFSKIMVGNYQTFIFWGSFRGKMVYDHKPTIWSSFNAFGHFFDQFWLHSKNPKTILLRGVDHICRKSSLQNINILKT